MADASGGSGGGGVSPFYTYTYDQMKEMAYADDPAAIASYAAEWARAARDLRIFQQMLNEELDSLGEVYESAEGAPALIQAISGKATTLGETAARFERNARVLESAAIALRTARELLKAIEPEANQDTGVTWRDASQMGPMARQAVPVMDALAQALTLARDQLEFNPHDDVDSPGDGAGAGSDTTPSKYVTAPGPGDPGATGGPGAFPPIGGGSTRDRGRSLGIPPSGLPPTAGGRSPVTPGGGMLPGTDPGTQRGGVSTGRTAQGAPGGAGAGRIRVPGAQSGAPIGGYRPTTGAPGGAPAGAQAGGATPGNGGPAGPGRPGGGPVPPAGHGAAPGGKDRPGRRLTHYEKLEADTFRDTRHRTKPVIGEQRRKPDSFQAIPGTIGAGNKQTSDTPQPRESDLPTREAPKRLEGHDVSVSFTRRPRSGP